MEINMRAGRAPLERIRLQKNMCLHNRAVSFKNLLVPICKFKLIHVTQTARIFFKQWHVIHFQNNKTKKWHILCNKEQKNTWKTNTPTQILSTIPMCTYLYICACNCSANVILLTHNYSHNVKQFMAEVLIWRLMIMITLIMNDWACRAQFEEIISLWV